MLGLAVPALAASSLLLGPSAHAVLPDDYQLPFPCGDSWYGSTRSGHSPSYWSIDFNRENDLGALTLASAPGEVTVAADLGDRSYGKYVVVEHGDRHSTVYAHLSAMFVTAGQRLDAGAPLGAVGSTGGSTGPHLHYEQRLDRVGKPAVFDGEPFRYGTTVASGNCGDVPVAGDWDGDGRADVGVFRPRPTTAAFRLRLRTGTTKRLLFGAPGTVPVVGDWDGDRHSDVAVWDQPARTFARLLPDGTVDRLRVGRIRDVPVVGDWDGNGRTDVGIWRPYSGRFVLFGADGSRSIRILGTVADTPVTGDWDGDGRTDVGVVDTATMTFRLLRGDGTLREVVFGVAGDRPVIGDWNGNGAANIGVWRPSTGEFVLRLSATRSTVIRYGRVR
ncbi:MAG: VCBS repeat domain-containing M23 family metallopeptidase [Actinomycetota bacterium]|nr:VCBS repeat domain-containing M23 family metallopeptidase [Actinomycetota bacterium]